MQEPMTTAPSTAPSFSSPDPSLPRDARLDAVLRGAGLSRGDQPSAMTAASMGDDSPLSKIPVKGQELLEKFFGSGAILFGTIFLSTGIGVSIEALCKVTGNPLPVWLDEALVQYVEPAMTPSILILFGFSISLGLLKQVAAAAPAAPRAPHPGPAPHARLHVRGAPPRSCK